MATITGDNFNNTLQGTGQADTIYGLDGADILNGGNGADQLFGGEGADQLNGGNGADTLNGGSGADILTGGAGNDIYEIDALDTLIEQAGQGTDEVRADFSYTLLQHFENLRLQGTANINGTGNAANNTIWGNSGNNILDGAGGTDTLRGGAGDDVYVTDGGDTIVENNNQGTDEVRASVSYALGNNLENLSLTGNAAINATGNNKDNVLSGNDGDNIVDGGAGNDTYQIVRPNGSYYLTSADLTAGTATGQGNDTLLNIENVRGSNLTDYITGNAGNNVLDGAGGHDEIFATNGVDTLIGGDGADAARFDNTGAVNANLATGVYTIDANNHGTMSSFQHVIGSAFDDTLTGDGAVNHMGGGMGNDVMSGGGGNDQIWGGGGSDRLIADGGNDTLVGNNNYGQGTSDNASDTFVIMSNAGDIIISDFKLGVDKLDLTDFGFDQNGVSAYWTGSAAQDGPHTVLTLTGLNNETVEISLHGVTEGHQLTSADFIGGSPSLIPNAPSYPVNGGNGTQDIIEIDPNDIITNFGGNLVVDHFEDGLDLLDISALDVMNSSYWSGYMSNTPGTTDTVLEFHGAQGEFFTVTMPGQPYWLMDQADYIL